MKNPKYRIVERAEHFYIQKRFLWFNCWYDLTIEEWGIDGMVIPLTLAFTTYKEALKYLNRTFLHQDVEKVLSYH